MRLTRQELVALVKEEIAHPRDNLGKNIADVEFPVLVGYEDVSEIAYNQSELDDILDTITTQGIAYSLDSLADVEVQDLPTGVGIEMVEKLSISKKSLSEMIKKSVMKVVKEQVVGYHAPEEGDESESGRDSGDDYLTVGQTSIAAAPDSHEEKSAADTSTRELTQQRQEYLDKDDAVTADDTGRQLQDLLNQKNEGKVRITKRQLRQIIKEAILSEQPAPVGQSVKSTHPESTKVYAVRYPDDLVGKYAGHEATGANDPEVKSAAQKAGVEIKPGSGRGRNFEVIGNKHSLSNFDKEYRAATKSIRDAISREHGSHMDRWQAVRTARDAAGTRWREMESKQKKDWKAGKLDEVPPIMMSDAYSEEEMIKVDPPDLKFAKKLRNT